MHGGEKEHSTGDNSSCGPPLKETFVEEVLKEGHMLYGLVMVALMNNGLVACCIDYMSLQPMCRL